MYATCSYCLQHSPQPYLQDSSSVHRNRVLLWGGKFSRPHKSNLTCIKPLISTDSHSMAAYIFLWWVLVRICFSQIRHFREIMQLPMLRNSRLIDSLTVLSAAVRTRIHSRARRKKRHMNSWSPSQIQNRITRSAALYSRFLNTRRLQGMYSSNNQ